MYQLNPLRKHLKRINAGHFIDMATGEGDFLLYLIEAFGSFESATGLDISDSKILQARLRFAKVKVDLVQGNVRKLPFEDNYFDTVTVSNSLHHFEYPEKAVQSMIRVLLPGGLFLVNEMINEDLNPAQQAHIMYHHLKADIDTALGTFHRKIYTREEVLGLLTSCGLQPAVEVVSIEDPTVYSREQFWLFTRKIDDLVSNTSHLARNLEFDERAQEVKAQVEEHGLQKPPQFSLLLYKD